MAVNLGLLFLNRRLHLCLLLDEKDSTESQMHFSDVLNVCENDAFEVVISKKNKRLFNASPSSDDAQNAETSKKRILEVELEECCVF
jgi:hypothetical protein